MALDSLVLALQHVEENRLDQAAGAPGCGNNSGQGLNPAGRIVLRTVRSLSFLDDMGQNQARSSSIADKRKPAGRHGCGQ